MQQPMVEQYGSLELDIEEVRRQYASFDGGSFEEALRTSSPDSSFDHFAMEAEQTFCRSWHWQRSNRYIDQLSSPTQHAF